MGNRIRLVILVAVLGLTAYVSIAVGPRPLPPAEPPPPPRAPYDSELRSWAFAISDFDTELGEIVRDARAGEDTAGLPERLRRSRSRFESVGRQVEAAPSGPGRLALLRHGVRVMGVTLFIRQHQLESPGAKASRPLPAGIAERLERHALALGEAFRAISRDPAVFDAAAAAELRRLWDVYELVRDQRPGFPERVPPTGEVLSRGLAGITGPLVEELKALAAEIQQGAGEGVVEAYKRGRFENLRKITGRMQAADARTREGVAALELEIARWEALATQR